MKGGGPVLFLDILDYFLLATVCCVASFTVSVRLLQCKSLCTVIVFGMKEVHSIKKLHLSIYHAGQGHRCNLRLILKNFEITLKVSVPCSCVCSTPKMYPRSGYFLVSSICKVKFKFEATLTKLLPFYTHIYYMPSTVQIWCNFDKIVPNYILLVHIDAFFSRGRGVKRRGWKL